MKTLTSIAFSTSLLCPFAYASGDILNFKNNDTLHGEFIGFSDTEHLKWKSLESSDEIAFSTKEIRKVIFNNGLSREKFSHTSLLTLSNGDKLPCSILSITDDSVNLQTDYAGNITVAREHIRSCALNPLGQQIVYQGPYRPSQWEVKTLTSKSLADDAPSEGEVAPPWEFGSFGWYNRGVPGAVVLKDFELPEDFRLLFSTEALRYSNVSLIFNADFKAPEIPEKKEGKVKPNSAQKMMQITGSCLALRINSNSTSLTMYSLSESGEPTYTNLKSVLGRPSYKQAPNETSSQVELRVDSSKKVFSVFRDGQLVNQWNLFDLEIVPEGRGLGFMSQTTGDAYLTRISDITVAPWNSVMDSARSLESDRADIVLLNNGTDRFSGDIIALDESSLSLDGAYAEMDIPLQNLQSIHFNLSKITVPTQKQKSEVIFQFYNQGFINATPVGTTKSGIMVSHPILGELDINFKFLTAISYDPKSSLIDQWNTKIK